MQVKWSRKVLLNLHDAVKYIADDGPVKAAEVAQRIWNSAQQLAEQPGMGRLGRVAGTRELVIPGLPYILPYVERGMAVIILRVLHAAMKWPQKL